MQSWHKHRLAVKAADRSGRCRAQYGADPSPAVLCLCGGQGDRKGGGKGRDWRERARSAPHVPTEDHQTGL